MNAPHEPFAVRIFIERTMMRMIRRGSAWTTREDRLLAALFPNAEWPELLAALPRRTKAAIDVRAQRLGLHRGLARQQAAARLRGIPPRIVSQARSALRRLLDGFGRVDPLEIFSDAGSRAHVPILARQQRVA